MKFKLEKNTYYIKYILTLSNGYFYIVFYIFDRIVARAITIFYLY